MIGRWWRERWKRRDERLANKRKQFISEKRKWFSGSSQNSGLAHEALHNLPHVTRTHYSGGWTCYVDVSMDDGFTVTKFDSQPWDAFCGCAHKVLDRLEERWGIARKIAEDAKTLEGETG